MVARVRAVRFRDVGRHLVRGDADPIDARGGPHLYSAQQEQDKDDHQEQADTAAWSVAPVPTVGPAWQRADEQQDQYDQQDGAEHGSSFRRLGDRDSLYRGTVYAHLVPEFP